MASDTASGPQLGDKMRELTLSFGRVMVCPSNFKFPSQQHKRTSPFPISLPLHCRKRKPPCSIDANRAAATLQHSATTAQPQEPMPQPLEWTPSTATALNCQSRRNRKKRCIGVQRKRPNNSGNGKPGASPTQHSRRKPA